jgi:hypothetical protein
MVQAAGLVLHIVGLAEMVKAWQPYNLKSKYFGLSPSIGIFFFLILDMFFLTNT